MPISNIQLAQLSPPCVPSLIPPALQTRLDRINGVRPGAIPQPVLRFTDLISGPSSGLGDGLGSGVIVTVWGQGLGDTTGTITFTDSNGVERPAAHIYYWKRANGQLPSGPANLWDSHLMYEVAFSIPASSATGLGNIKVTMPSGQLAANTMPFTVRSGRILWVAPGGANENPGTFISPKAFINAGNPGSSGLGNYLLAGDTIYSRGVVELPISETGRDALYIRDAVGSLAEQIMIVGYPNTRSEVRPYAMGFHPYNSRAVGLSKFRCTQGNNPPSPPGELVQAIPIYGNVAVVSCQEGRYIGLEITDNLGTCSTGQSGAINAGGMGMDNAKYLGCHLHDIGCDGTSHYQHTTYLSSRGAFTVNAPEMAFMHISDCKAKFGIHIYDQEFNGNSIMLGTVKLHNNLIIRQKGAGISAHGPTPWTSGLHVYNNILIECGKGPIAEIPNGTSAEAMYLGIGWLPSECRIEDNLIMNYSDSSARQYSVAAAAYIDFRGSITDYRFSRNVIISNGNFDCIRFAGTNTATPTNSDKNSFISTDPSNTKTLPIGWTGSIQNTDLKLSVFQNFPDIQLTSPLNIDGTYSRLDNYDMYGRLRADTLGPVEAV